MLFTPSSSSSSSESVHSMFAPAGEYVLTQRTPLRPPFHIACQQHTTPIHTASMCICPAQLASAAAAAAASGEFSTFYFGQNHPMKPHRLTMTHQLVLGYDLQQHMDIFVSGLCVL
jgi:hypothetical protein